MPEIQPGHLTEQTRDAVEMLIALRGDITTGWFARNTVFVLSLSNIGVNYGFDGGRVPKALDEMLTAWTGSPRSLPQPVWHAALWDLVGDHLLPMLADLSNRNALSCPDIVFVETTGNPIRWASQHKADDWFTRQTQPVGRRITVDWTTVFAHALTHLHTHDKQAVR